jgi:type II secretory pathway pseudopilin PulG
MRRTRSRHAPYAFTLVEALVVVGIIIVLVSFLFVGLSKAKDSSRRAICGNNLRQIMSAISVYASANDKLLPVLPDWSGSQHWLCDIGRDQRDALLAAGLQRDSFYCPSGDLQNAENQWNYGRRDQPRPDLHGDRVFLDDVPGPQVPAVQPGDVDPG